jgi:hypothetical protein
MSIVLGDILAHVIEIAIASTKRRGYHEIM